MKKALRVIFILALTLALSLVLASCGGDKGDTNNNENNNPGGNQNTETSVTYTVTVVDQNNNAVKGVTVEFTADGKTVPYTTKNAGTATFTSKSTVSAKVSALPSGYTYANLDKALTFDKNGNVTVTVTAPESATATYTVKVVDQNGNPIAGVKVQSCDDVGNCQPPRVTDANGEAPFAPNDGYHAQLTIGSTETVESLYPGYTVNDPSAKYDFVDGVATITLTKVEE